MVAHLQFAQANSQTKNCKRACLSATVEFADSKKTKSFKTVKNGMTDIILSYSVSAQWNQISLSN